MTNAELISRAMQANGVTEDSHTYAHWKSLGYQVRKGEKAAFKCVIWRPNVKEVEVGGEETEALLAMYMKTASFFTKSQVDKVEK